MVKEFITLYKLRIIFGSYIHIYTYKGTFRVNMYINTFAFLLSYVLGIKWDFNAATLAMDDLLGNSGIKIDKI